MGEGARLAHEGHGYADNEKRTKDEDTGPGSHGHVAADKHGNQVPEEVGSADKAHLGIRKVQCCSHGRKEHADGEPADAEACHDAEHAGKYNHPPVMEGRLLSFRIFHKVKYTIV